MTTRRFRHQKIMELVSAKRIGTQQELALELAMIGAPATQSSVSRDIVELGLTKIDGFYAAPDAALSEASSVIDIDTAGENIIVVKTEIGQAQPAALKIDDAKIAAIVGTVAGDDTIIIAVKNVTAQRSAIRQIVKLFASPPSGRDQQKHRDGRSKERGSGRSSVEWRTVRHG